MTFDHELAEIRFMVRRRANRGKDRIDNSTLYAGSPMYYYCHACYEFLCQMDELHNEPSPGYCHECRELKNHHILEKLIKEADDG